MHYWFLRCLKAQLLLERRNLDDKHSKFKFTLADDLLYSVLYNLHNLTVSKSNLFHLYSSWRHGELGYYQLPFKCGK